MEIPHIKCIKLFFYPYPVITNKWKNHVNSLVQRLGVSNFRDSFAKELHCEMHKAHC